MNQLVFIYIKYGHKNTLHYKIANDKQPSVQNLLA